VKKRSRKKKTKKQVEHERWLRAVSRATIGKSLFMRVHSSNEKCAVRECPNAGTEELSSGKLICAKHLREGAKP
jgi:hypothetical protein